MMKSLPWLCTTSTRNTWFAPSCRSIPTESWCTFGFCSFWSMTLMPDAPAPGRMNPVNGLDRLGANGGTCPVAGSMNGRLPARTSIGSARPSRPRSSDWICSVTRS